VEADLAKQSHYDRHRLRVLTGEWKQNVEDMRTKVAAFDTHIEALKNERKERSAALQGQLFEQYAFLNKSGKSKSLQDIFAPTAFGRPPAGAGECATPKLLQYAFASGYEHLPWQSSGGERHQNRRLGNINNITRPVPASASLYWHICWRECQWTKTHFYNP